MSTLMLLTYKNADIMTKANCAKDNKNYHGKHINSINK